MSTLADRMTRREAPSPAADAALATGSTTVPPSRRGKRGVLVHVDPAVLKRIKYIAVDQERSQHSLLLEAVDDLILKYGR